MDSHLDIKTVIELFVNRALSSIKCDHETAKFNIVFEDKTLFNNPIFKFESYCLPDALNPEIDAECPTVYVHDTNLFFETLTNIVNAQIDLNHLYGKYRSTPGPEVGVANIVMRRIWLRMSPNDIDDIESFLATQLAFLENTMFDAPKEEKIIPNQEERITYEVEDCETWCESTRRMCFRIYEGDNYHDLPKIYYDLKEENGEMVCYIFAVQMPTKRSRLKNVERKLYKLNKGLEETKVHPNFLMAMKLFYEFLESQGINHIKVPLLQVLSYRYHIGLSNDSKKMMATKWTPEKIAKLSKYQKLIPEYYKELKKEYEGDLSWFKATADREDFISKAKTEGLIDLFSEMTQLSNSSINTEPFISAPYLDITLNNEKKIEKRK